jgi:crotonobetainyl-CoA:carnitine CoA-transferase CaiB-like acyl-CoA transferase
MTGRERYAFRRFTPPPVYRYLCLQIRSPSGSSLTGIVPTNAYPCLPSSTSPSAPAYIVIGANGDTLYNRLMEAIGRPDLIGPQYLHNNHRVERQAEIEGAISAWTSKRTVEEVERVMNEAKVPVGRVVNVKEIVEGEQIRARGAIEEVWVGDSSEKEGWNVKMLAAFPVLEGCDTRTRWAGPNLGQHTDEILAGELGLTSDRITKLRETHVVG